MPAKSRAVSLVVYATFVGAVTEMDTNVTTGLLEDDEDELVLVAGVELLVVLASLLLDELVELDSTTEEVSADPELALLEDGASAGLQAPKTIPIVIASVRKASFFLFFIRFSFLALCNMF